MALFKHDRIQIEETGQTVNVPNSPTGRLMYYLDCVSTVLDLHEISELRRYTNYSNHYNMTIGDKNVIVRLCVLFSPDELINKCFFESPEMCGSSSNQFYKITAQQLRVAAANDIVIGGISRNVTQIMAFKMDWMVRNYINPLRELVNELRTPPRIQYNNYTRRTSTPQYNYKSNDSSCCNIL